LKLGPKQIIASRSCRPEACLPHCMRHFPPLKPRKVLASYRVGDLAYWALSHDLAIFDADDRQTMPGSGIVIIG
jgi:hypothetical protein